jgi:hypothetical protein
MLAEWVMFLPYEYRIWKRLLWERKSCPISHYILLGIRWGIISTIFPVYIFFFARPQNCTATLVLIWATFTVCWAFCSLLFVLRVSVIWSYDRRIMAFFGILWVGVLGVWIAVTSTFRGAYIPGIPSPQPWCAQADPSPWHPAGWGANMVFDICVLAATVYKLYPGPHSRSVSSGSSANMRRFILKSNLWYFAGSVLAEIVCFTLQMSIQNIDIAQVPSPITFALTPILAARIVYASMDHTYQAPQNNKDVEHAQTHHSTIKAPSPSNKMFEPLWTRQSGVSTYDSKIMLPPVSSSSHPFTANSQDKMVNFDEKTRAENPPEVCQSKTESDSVEMAKDWVSYNGSFAKQRTDSSSSNSNSSTLNTHTLNTPRVAATPRVDIYTTTVRSEPDPDFEETLRSGRLGWTRHPNNF